MRGRNFSACVSAPSLLKLIRDGRVQTVSDFVTVLELDKLKREQRTLAYRLKKMLDRNLAELKSVGVIEIEASSRRCSVTKAWLGIQGALGISLSALVNGEADDLISVRPYFGVPRALRDNTDVFVLMPFRPELKPIYEDHVVNALKRDGLSVKRADDFFTAHAVMEDIWAAICASRVVIADCTDRNPNVFYEIGLAHAIGKPVVLITQRREDVPFDLQGIRYIHYAYTPRGMSAFEEALARTVRETLGL